MFRAAVGRMLGAGKGHQGPPASEQSAVPRPREKPMPATGLDKKSSGVPTTPPPPKAAKPNATLLPPKVPLTRADDRAPVLPPSIVDSLPQRSVKISFAKGSASNLTQEYIAEVAGNFGKVVQVGMKDKYCVVLFTTASEAMQCSTSFDEFQALLPAAFASPEAKLRVKYMGGGGNLDDSYTSQSFDNSISMAPSQSFDNSISMAAVLAKLDDGNTASNLTLSKVHDETLRPNRPSHDSREQSVHASDVMKLDEFSYSQASMNQPSLLLDELEEHDANDAAAHVSKMPRTESNISLQSDTSTSLSRAHSQIFGNDADDAEEDDYIMGGGSLATTGGGWKNAYAVPAIVQIPHYSQQPAQQMPQYSRSLDVSLDDAKLAVLPAVTPAVTLTTKKPIQVKVGSPSSSPRSPSEHDRHTWNDLSAGSDTHDTHDTHVHVTTTAANTATAATPCLAVMSANAQEEPSNNEICDRSRLALEAGDLLEDDNGDAEEDSEDGNEESSRDEGTLAGSNASSRVSKPVRLPQSVMVKIPAVSLPLRPPRIGSAISNVHDGAPSSHAAAGATIASCTVEDAGAESQPTNPHPVLQKKFNEVLGRMRLLEAEAKVRSRERSDLEREMQICEDKWESELMELEIRNAKLDAECASLKESNRRARIEAARIAGELSASLVAKDAAEALLEGAAAKAESDVLSTVLSQQRLIGLLDKQKDAAMGNLGQYREGLSLLRDKYKTAIAESLDWKARALHAEARLPNMRLGAGAMGGDYLTSEDLDEQHSAGESKNDVTFSNGCVADEQKQVDQEDGDKLIEASFRVSVKNEMEKYLALINRTSCQDDLLVVTGSPPITVIDRHKSRDPFMTMTAEQRTRNISEGIALDLATSRKKLESIRTTSIR